MRDPGSTDAPTLTDEEKALVAAIVRERPWEGKVVRYAAIPRKHLALIYTILMIFPIRPDWWVAGLWIVVSIVVDRLILSKGFDTEKDLTYVAAKMVSFEQIPGTGETKRNKYWITALLLICLISFFTLFFSSAAYSFPELVVTLCWLEGISIGLVIHLIYQKNGFPREPIDQNAFRFEIDLFESQYSHGYEYYSINIANIFTLVTLYYILYKIPVDDNYMKSLRAVSLFTIFFSFPFFSQIALHATMKCRKIAKIYAKLKKAQGK